MFRKLAIGASLAALLSGAAAAQEAIKIGLLTTLSGPAAVLGQQQRNGLQLGLKLLGNKLGGIPVELLVQDDEQKPDVGVTKAKAFVERDQVQFVVGPIFSNVLLAYAPTVLRAETMLISPNAGPSSMAGKNCNVNFFVTSYQNDQNHEVLGKVAQKRGFKKVILLTPNYQAGKDAVAGFKRHYTGEVADEIYTPLGQLDFSAELAKIAAAKPDAIFTFMPGGMGVNLVKQFRQAGLADKVVFLSAFTVDESTLPAQQDAALGLFGGQNWAPNLDNAANKKFVAAYEAEFKAVPGTYAAQAFDTVNLLDAAIKAAGGVKDKAKLRAAIRNAKFDSVRGSFEFSNNNYPKQDFYLVKAAKRADGRFQTEIVEKVSTATPDVYAKECPLK